MAVITDYNSLIAAVQAVAEDDGVEFAAYVPTAIDLAEEKLFKELDLPELETPFSGTLTTNSNTVTKPTGYKLGNYFRITVAGKNSLLRKRREDYIVDYWPDPTLTDVPKYYADLNATTFVLAPTPNNNYTYTIKYSLQPLKLTVSNTTNYFVQKCQPILYMAVLVEMARFMKAWSQIAVWQQELNKLTTDWNMNMARYRREDGEVPHNPDGGPNSLVHTQNTKA